MLTSNSLAGGPLLTGGGSLGIGDHGGRHREKQRIEQSSSAEEEDDDVIFSKLPTWFRKSDVKFLKKKHVFIM